MDIIEYLRKPYTFPGTRLRIRTLCYTRNLFVSRRRPRRLVRLTGAEKSGYLLELDILDTTERGERGLSAIHAAKRRLRRYLRDIPRAFALFQSTKLTYINVLAIRHQLVLIDDYLCRADKKLSVFNYVPRGLSRFHKS